MPQPVPPPVTPEATPDDVAALITARTKDDAGRELGHWSDTTRPTVDQVQMRIDIARSLVAKEAGGYIPDTCLEIAESAVALLASMLCEAAFWPEQVTNNQSSYDRLARLYDQSRESLALCMTGGVEYGAYELNVGDRDELAWPIDWWQRNAELTP